MMTGDPMKQYRIRAFGKVECCMANREYYVGETIKADGDLYRITGKIIFRNPADGKTWEEYKLIAVNYNQEERWLSVDNSYKEYSLSRINPSADTMGYHQVDAGTQEVVSAEGDVDVVKGDTARFVEYEDSTEEKIISMETWEDGAEYSSGYYLDPWEFGREGENVSRSGSGGSGSGGKGLPLVVICFVMIWLAGFGGSSISGLFSNQKVISRYLKNSNVYQYTTSITGEDKQKADVYRFRSDISVEGLTEEAALLTVAYNIIDGINGKSESVQQNNEPDDHTVAILTKKEYCIVYWGDDNKIYAQVSPRKYAYTTDKEPYHSRRGTHRYFRRFYYSTGYRSDSSAYSHSPSSYTGYSDGEISYDSGNELNSYSNSVRQSSAASRSSDGGGLSSGK